MWLRLRDYLACPACNGALSLHDFAGPSAVPADGTGSVDRWIADGCLTCAPCRLLYPIVDGLPVLLLYPTPAAAMWRGRFSEQLTSLRQFEIPVGAPPPGEEFVQRSFSREWDAYDYDGVMWDLSYADHELRFLAECGDEALAQARNELFVEIGCGLGVTTMLAQKHLSGDAIGVDLGAAAARATHHFRSNPRLHFVQASAFALPLRRASAALVYSHGVLHHTYSTEEAVTRAARLCRPGAWFYVWLYGPASKRGSLLRRAAWAAEAALRPTMARHEDRRAAQLTLRAAALVYLLANRWHHFRDPSVQTYTFARALHAARDRFTPLYAHRHSFDEVARWLAAAGFESILQVDWRSMPTANQANYRRNVGVRAQAGRPIV